MSRTTDSKKQIILDFINEYYGSYGETPTVRDIAAGTGIAVTSVHRYLSAMKEDGELEYNGRRSVSTRRMEMEQVAHAMPVLGYGGDYAELRILKELADELGICLLLVHHLRKMNDKDPVNKLSGSTGISGAVDAIFVLDKNERMERLAMLHVSGRDIRDRKIQLELDKDTCVWNRISDTLTMPETTLPDELISLYYFMTGANEFIGTNTELAGYLRKDISPKGLKQMMNRYRYQLEDLGVFFESKRSNGQKYVVVRYVSPADGDSSDSVSSALTDSVPFVPCVPAENVG